MFSFAMNGRRTDGCLNASSSTLWVAAWSSHPSIHSCKSGLALQDRIEANSMALHGIALWIIDKLIQRRFEENDPNIFPTDRPNDIWDDYMQSSYLYCCLLPIIASHPPIKTQTDRLRHPLRTHLIRSSVVIRWFRSVPSGGTIDEVL